jgi:N-acetylgalactosamine kinase
MAARTPLYSVVLAAGKGRRMRNQVFHKVCFQIAGVPAIHRALDAYNRIGVVRNVVVVGDLAGQVVETVGKQFRNVVFAFQPDARGTGDAARCGLQALSEIDPDARILIVAGDKIIENAALTRLVRRAEETDADLAVLVTPAEWGGSSAGRVLFGPDERPLAIVEMADIKLRACRTELRQALEAGEPTEAELQAVVTRHLGPTATLARVLELDESIVGRTGSPSESRMKATTVVGATTADGRTASPSCILARLAALPCDVRIAPEPVVFSAAEAAAARFRNESVYLVRKRAIDFGLEQMAANNAQGELYLTDAIGAIFRARGDTGPRFRICHVPTETPVEVMSYNNPEELLRIEDHFHGQRRQSLEELRTRLEAERFKTIDDWLALFPAEGQLPEPTRSAFVEYYGDDPALLAEKSAAYRSALLCFRQHFGRDRSVILVRSPGRINVMGRHIDWQGGRCNLMAVTQEVIMAVAPRADDLLEARNVDPRQFPDVSISIGRLVSQLDWDDWLSVVNSSGLTRHLRESAGNWSLYLEAALLRLQMAHREHHLRGMDMAVCGNIPVAAGLSSSSALVVATAESALALHGLEVSSQQFVNFCGEGEWFVGTRGGSADHAAMKYGQKGTINHVAFHEFQLLEQLAFPRTHALVVCNSFIQAKKAGGAREAFNARVGSYLVGVQLVRRLFPQYAPLIRFVRDISCENLRVPPSRIYEILTQLPESMTAAEVRAMFQNDADAWTGLASHFGTARDEAVYPVRGVLMFGITECARSVRAADCLRRQDMQELGTLMRTSHDGERCFATRADGSAEPFLVDISDAALHRLIEDLGSEDLARIERAQLWNQPGAYRCSTQEIDTLVDIAGRTPGVAGAQIAGAGLGGCAMILVRAENVPALEANLLRDYYAPRQLPNGVVRCTPSAGSCLLAIGGAANS